MVCGLCQFSSIKGHAQRLNISFEKEILWDELYLFKSCPNGIIKRCVFGKEIQEILEHCHKGPAGGHYGADITARNIFESGFYWPTIFKDAAKHVRECDACQRARNISSRNQMPFTNIIVSEALRTTYKSPIGCTPFKIVYGKACHLPIEMEHKAYWALKNVNLDLDVAGRNSFLQLNKLKEIRNEANEHSRAYKERTKRWHNARIMGKLKTRWYGPYMVSKVFPYGTVEVCGKDGIRFKVNGHRIEYVLRNPQAAIVSEEELVPRDYRLKITKNNQGIASNSNITDSFSVRYNYYKTKKDQSGKDNDHNTSEEQNVSRVGRVQEKGYMCSVNTKVEEAFADEKGKKLKDTDSQTIASSSWSSDGDDKDDDKDDAENSNMDISGDDSDKTDADAAGFRIFMYDKTKELPKFTPISPTITFYIETHTTFVVANPLGNPKELFEDAADHQLHNILFDSMSLDQEHLNAQDTKPTLKRRPYDDQDPPIDHEGEKRSKIRKDARESSSKSSKKYKDPMDCVQNGIHADQPQDKENQGNYQERRANYAGLEGAGLEMLKSCYKNNDELEYHVDQLKEAMTEEIEWSDGDNGLTKLRSFEKHMFKSAKPDNRFYNRDYYYLKWGYGFLTSIKVKRTNNKEYEISYADLSRLSLNDIEDMYLLKIQGKVHHLKLEYEVDFINALLVYIRRVVIKNRIEDTQLGVESYQRTLNLTKPKFYISGIDHKIPYTMIGTEKGVIYLNKYDVKSLILREEVHKFCDGTLIKVQDKLQKMLNENILGRDNMKLKGREWTKNGIKRSKGMLENIDKTLKHRDQLRRLEEYVGEIPKTIDIRAFVRP
ncbi:reverse transcriptase domain-containing protein [Tanacetum coccineum]